MITISIETRQELQSGEAMTPLDKVEVLYNHLLCSYGGAPDAPIRAATKLLIVALHNLQQNAGADWLGIVQEYTDILRQDPEKFEKFLDVNRSDFDADALVINITNPDVIDKSAN
jgi:hypothetical protein